MPDEVKEREESGGGGFRLLVVPDDGGETRSVHVGAGLARLLPGGLVLAGVLVVLLLGSWAYLAVRAARVGPLEQELARMEGQEARLEALTESMREVESQYDRLRSMFGSDTTRSASELWLPALDAAGSTTDPPAGGEGPPSTWPLAQRGFVTQTLLEGDNGEHQGLDIAVPTQSYIRAAGAGRVIEAGEDPVYGRYVVIDHGSGYESVYGHASETLVEVDQEVRAGEVIALSGSTGRSTAPHLHFEILVDGEPVDPLTLVVQP